MPETNTEKMVRLRLHLRQSVTGADLELPDFTGDGQVKRADKRMRLAQLAANVEHVKNATGNDADIDTVANEIRVELDA